VLLIVLQKLCDNDPGVMGATLCPLYDLVLEDPNAEYKDLVVSFVNIMKQVAERRHPTSATTSIITSAQRPAPLRQDDLCALCPFWYLLFAPFACANELNPLTSQQGHDLRHAAQDLREASHGGG
jgi:hypothetical protein